MIRVLIALIIAGRASQYAPGVMDRVIVVRQSGVTAHTLPATLPAVDGYVAARECADIGTVVWLRPAGAENWESFLVTDCASKTDHQSKTDPRSGYQWMHDNGILVEIDHKTAVRWGTVGMIIAVEMATDDPSSPRYIYDH